MKGLISVLALGIIVSITSCGKNNCKENIVEDCITTYELYPVCGCNGKTYDNPSIAACSGIEDYTIGECQ